MNRIDRLHAILTVLQSKRVIRAEDIAKRFEISLRTVYRDLRALEEGGIPIGAEAGVGYFLTEGFHLPPVMFTHDEARSLLLAGKLVEKQTDQLTNKSFLNALTKVRAVLDAEKKDDLEGLDQKIIVNPFPIDKLEDQDLRINAIKQVLSENKVIQITYLSANQESCRTIESLGLVYYSNKWHLIGWCRLRKDYRDFRLDRIQEMEVLPERFLRINHLSLGQYLEKLNKDTELITVVIKVHNSLLKFIENSKYSMGLIKEENTDDEFTEMTFASCSVEYFSRWMLMLGTKAVVVSPKELMDKVKEHTLSMYKLYHQ